MRLDEIFDPKIPQLRDPEMHGKLGLPSYAVQSKDWSHSGKEFAMDPSHPAYGTMRPNIGPHEGKELNMMIAGVKPAALVPSANIRQWASAIQNHKFHVARVDSKPDLMIVTLPGQEWRIQQIAKHLQTIRPQVPGGNVDNQLRTMHQELGKLLGYTPDAVAAFLKQQGLE